jgi:NAD+ synthase (glutamine-hydrolysing)
MFGFYRIGTAVPKLKIGNIEHNINAIREMAESADSENVSVIIFPELCVTSYSCADLFHQSALLEKIPDYIGDLAKKTKKIKSAIVIGAPLRWRNGVYNCALVMAEGEVKGIAPKSVIPNFREFYEKRWFNSGKEIKSKEFEFNGKKVPFGANLIFSDGADLKFSVEICADLWGPIPPSCHHSIAGANLILNLSASNDIVSKADYRRDLVRMQSARCVCAYAYCSSGISESTTDIVFGGHCIIAENGEILSENTRFKDSSFLYADIDCQKLSYLRFSESGFRDAETYEHEIIPINIRKPEKVRRKYDTAPFVPSDKRKRDERCSEIFEIQASALARRMEHTNAKKLIVGVSGGLDSTLALLASEKAVRKMGKNSSALLAVTMPGFGTSARTLKNACELVKILNAELRTIDIKEICKKHLEDIGQTPLKHNLVFENAQSRERTQILMDIANAEEGIVVGTGDLSEIALGWSTFNGDHISMYAVNCGIPKTLIRYIVQWVSDNSQSQLSQILIDILDTPVSPELLPRKKDGNMSQETEKIIGPYDLHDFFLYHTVKYGADPAKILHIAKIAFNGRYEEKYIKNTFKTFISRFFSNQFKRNCVPDGPKVGTIALSPRGDWRMVSDADPSEWLKNINE